MINLTSDVTRECFEWCKDQHFIHQSNVSLINLWLLIAAVVLIWCAYIVDKFKLDIELQDRMIKYDNLSQGFMLGSVVLIIAYLFLVI